MPLRSRLRTTNLRLKIPATARNPNSVTVSSPYGAAGGRHSASPGARRDKEENGYGFSSKVSTLQPPLSTQQQSTVSSFDASIDSRPVWESNEQKSTRTCTEGFRDIPMLVSDTECQASSSNLPPSGTNKQSVKSKPKRSLEESYRFRSSLSEPESPVLDLSPPLHLQSWSPDLKRVTLRAQHLRDWFHDLSPKISQEPKNRPNLNKSSMGTSNDGSILTPTDSSILESPLLSGGPARRDSSGVLQSPDVLDPVKEDGFYLLKKDSQRRTTLVKILRDDKHRICSTWLSLLLREVPDSCLTDAHLSTLMDGMKGFIPEQNQAPLEKAVTELREALDYDGTKINQLQLALYQFQEAVNSVLRVHSIKPHWMFALDGLVTRAVHAAIMVLSPELGAHLADAAILGPLGGQGVQVEEEDADEIDLHPGDEAGSTSGVSTSTTGAPRGGPPAGAPGPSRSHSVTLASFGRLREENRQLLSDLVSSQSSYQELLRQSLAEQKLHLQMLSQSLAASHLHNQHILGTETQRNVDDSQDSRNDPELVAWLEGLGLNRRSVDLCVAQDLTLSDILELMTRDDLKRLGLKAGPELRIWRAILKHRNIPLTPTP